MAGDFLRKLTDYSNPLSFGSRFRSRRFGRFLQMAEQVFGQYGKVHILDAGGTPEYWNLLSDADAERLNVQITVLNMYESLPCTKPYIHYVQGDACEMPQFRDGQFHLVYSNSVIEHVGLWYQKEQFAREVKRVGKAYYIQTPNFYFPVEPHFLFPFFHWLPQNLQIFFCMHMRLGYYKKCHSVAESLTLLQYNDMLSKKEFTRLFPEAAIMKEKFLGLTKSFTAVYLPK